MWNLIESEEFLQVRSPTLREPRRKQIRSKPQRSEAKLQRSSKAQAKKFRLRKVRSRELYAGVVYTDCDCYHRNGLQHDCPRTSCGCKQFIKNYINFYGKKPRTPFRLNSDRPIRGFIYCAQTPLLSGIKYSNESQAVEMSVILNLQTLHIYMCISSRKVRHAEWNLGPNATWHSTLCTSGRVITMY